MPVAKVNTTFDVVIKHLRRRSVSCLVRAVAAKSPCEDVFISDCTLNESLSNKTRIIPKSKHPTKQCSLETDLIISNPEKKLDSSLVTENQTSLSPTKNKTKRAYRRKTLQLTAVSNKCCHSDPDFMDDNAFFVSLSGKKRKPRLLCLPPSAAENKGKLSESNEIRLSNTHSPPDTEKPKKRAYRKKIPLVPQNTPISTKSSTYAESDTTFSTTSDESSLLPSKMVQGYQTPSSTKKWLDEDSNLTSNSTQSIDSKGKRRRGKCAYMDFEESEEEEMPSEYEIQCQKNIEDNLKKFRELFLMEKSLLYEVKSDEAPKPKKPYSRHPPPPPRPRSARLEYRHSSEPLDFSKLTCRLSLFN